MKKLAFILILTCASSVTFANNNGSNPQKQHKITYKAGSCTVSMEVSGRTISATASTCHAALQKIRAMM